MNLSPDILVELGVGVALVTAIVEAFKRAGMRTKYAPLATLVIGGLLATLWGYLNAYEPTLYVILWAVFSGVSALSYDSYRKATENLSPEQEALSLQRRLSFLKKQQENEEG